MWEAEANRELLAQFVLCSYMSARIEQRARGSGMNTLTNTSCTQYAVIQVRQSDGGIERFVIPYQNEEVLREFLAPPSIVASGLLSLDEARNEYVVVETTM